MGRACLALWKSKNITHSLLLFIIESVSPTCKGTIAYFFSATVFISNCWRYMLCSLLFSCCQIKDGWNSLSLYQMHLFYQLDLDVGGNLCPTFQRTHHLLEAMARFEDKKKASCSAHSWLAIFFFSVETVKHLLKVCLDFFGGHLVRLTHLSRLSRWESGWMAVCAGMQRCVVMYMALRMSHFCYACVPAYQLLSGLK